MLFSEGKAGKMAAVLIAITSGYFDPLHRGHLELLRRSAGQGDKLWVIVNNDRQAALKKGKAFLDEATRLETIGELRMVDRAFLAVDTDGSVCTLESYSRDRYRQLPRNHIQLLLCWR